MAFQRAQKNLDGNLPIERLKSAESCNLAASNRTGFEARRRRLARSAHAIEAERGARRPRWRPPEAARDLRLHGDLRRRLVAGEVCRIASTPTTASSPLSFLRRRLVGVSTRSSHCQDPACSTAPGIVRNRSKVLLTLTRGAHKGQGVLTRRAHTQRTHNYRSYAEGCEVHRLGSGMQRDMCLEGGGLR